MAAAGDRLKILVYGLNFAPELTGIGRFTGDMARWLATRGHAVHAVTAPPYYPEWRLGDAHRRFGWRRETLDGVVVRRCPLYVPGRPDGMRRVAHLLSFATTSWLPVLWHAARWKPDIVFNVEPALLTAPGARYAAWLADALAWLHVQDFEIDAAFDLGLLPARMAGTAGRFERGVTRAFHAVSTISPNMIARLGAKGVDPAATVLFPNWVETDRIRPDVPSAALRARLGIDEGAVVALYSGNMGRKQGVGTIADAAARIACTRAVADIRLVLCGEGAGRRDFEAALAARPQLAERVHLLPLQPEADLPALLAMADIHLLPQRAEAADLVMPSKLGGMLASGRPVIAGAAAGTQIAAAVEGCGIVVPPDDAAAMADAIVALAGDAGRRAALGTAARQRAVADWDREAVLGRFEAELLARVAAHRRSA
jgi:colanic acid biosynthesis glycosyl transferase WcaI